MFKGDLDRTGRLLAAARPVLSRFACPLYGTNTCLLLTDHNGWILERWVGSTDLTRQLDRNLTAQGYSLDEQFVGTNGPGTTIELGRPVQICGPEHFADQYQELTCAGAPIRNPMTGRVEGVVDLTCPLAETNGILLPYVIEAATEIERRLYMQTSTRDRRMLEEFLIASRRIAAPVISVNERVIIANPNAARRLNGIDLALVWERAVAAVRSGTADAFDLELPAGNALKMRCRPVFDGHDLLGVVLQGEQETRHNVQSSKRERTPTLPGLIAGRSIGWSEVERLAATVAREGMPCLIEGEPGVGKLSVARAISALSGRSTDTVEFDAAQACVIGARRWLDTLEGSLGQHHITVILSHIETLDDSTVRRLSALIDQRTATSEIIATRSLADAEPSTALNNLLARLKVASIEIPPLRERIDDLPALVDAFIARHGTTQQRFSLEALQVLSRLEWPGNVRELENVVRWSLSARRGPVVGLVDLPAHILPNVSSRRLTAIERSEFETIVRALRRAGGNKNATTKALGLARSTLYRKLRYYGVDLEHAIH